MTRPLAPLTALAWLALVACASSPAKLTPPGCAPACETGLQCLAGRCQPIGCKSNADCTAPLTCIAGLCADTSCEPACPPAQACLSTVCVPLEPTPCGASDPCPSGESCVAGICTSTGCVPACAGNDLCIEGVCVPPSTSCAPPYQACFTAGNPLCVNLNRDPDNCGACGSACLATQVCNGMGSCATVCATGETACGGDCVDLSASAHNCGACGQACAAGQICSGGSCAVTCASPLTTCGTGPTATCDDLQTDSNNCGSCGVACPVGLPCNSGACGTPQCTSPQMQCIPDGGPAYCADLTTDQNNCGACGNTCPIACCGGACVDTTQDLGNCGGCGTACQGGVAPPECMLGRCLLTLVSTPSLLLSYDQPFGLAGVGGRVFWSVPGVEFVYTNGDAGAEVFWDGGVSIQNVFLTDSLYALGLGNAWQLPLDGGTPAQIASVSGASGFAIGPTDVFWFDATSVYASPLAGGPALLLYDGGLGAISWVGAGQHTVGWAGASLPLQSAPFDGGLAGPVVVLDAGLCSLGGPLSGPYAMNDAFFFADISLGIACSGEALPLDGGPSEVIFSMEGGGTGNIQQVPAVDESTFYYGVPTSGSVFSFDPATGQPTLLVYGQAAAELTGIEGLAVDSASLYLLNDADGTIKQLTPK